MNFRLAMWFAIGPSLGLTRIRSIQMIARLNAELRDQLVPRQRRTNVSCWPETEVPNYQTNV